MRIVLWVGLGLIVLIAAAGLWLTFKSYTDPIFAPNAVASLEPIDVHGDRQHLLIRGRDADAPVLLILHGGPGMPSMFLAHRWQRELERDFVVVHWDRRNAGLSYDPGRDPSEMRISQILADAEFVIDHLRARFDEPDIYLMGHSFGSYVGALLASRRPDLVRAFIGVGQVVDLEEEVRVQDDYLRGRLAELGYPPDTEITGANRETLLFETGSELYAETTMTPLIVDGLLAPEYGLMDALNVGRGSSFASANMAFDVIDGPLGEEVTRFEVPVFMIMGSHDMTTPLSLARDYFERIEAPMKAWYEIEDASHFPFYERPRAFTAVMLEIRDAVETANQP